MSIGRYDFSCPSPLLLVVDTSFDSDELIWLHLFLQNDEGSDFSRTIQVGSFKLLVGIVDVRDFTSLGCEFRF